MKIYKYQKGFLAKSNNKRIVIREAEDRNETSFVQISIFSKSEAVFATIQNNRGIKTLTMRLSKETMENLGFLLLEHLKQK